MGYVFDYLGIARGRLRVVGAARQRRCGRIAGPFLPHALHLTLLRLRELGGNDDQAQVDHEERANLQMSGENQIFVKVQIKSNLVTFHISMPQATKLVCATN